MINSLFLTNSHLLALSGASTISVYDLTDLVSDPHQSLPKLHSTLGISLRKPAAVLELSSLNHNAKFVPLSANSTQPASNVFIYDGHNIIGLDLSQLSQHSPSLNVMFRLNIDSLGQAQNKTQISTVAVVNSNQKEGVNLLVTTTSGHISIVKPTSLMTYEVIKTISLISLQKPKSNKIITQSEQQSISLFNPTHQPHLCSDEHIWAMETDAKTVYMATSRHRLLSVNSDTLEMGQTFDTSGVKDWMKTGSKWLGQALKVVLLRNSLLLLYSRVIFQFNTYTRTLTNSLSLPIASLDLTVRYCPKTLQCSLLTVGEFNSLCSFPFPLQQPESNVQRQVSTQLVSISSRMGKCIGVKSNMVFVGGSDGTVDVLLNGEMLMMVLVQER